MSSLPNSTEETKIKRLPTADADGDLVARALLGDRRAEEQLYRRHVRSVVELATRLLGNAADGEDAAHDAFVTVFEKLGSLDDPDKFGPWVRAISVREIHRRFRRKRLLRRLGIGPAPVQWSRAVAADVSPEERAELRLAAKRLAPLPAAVRLTWMLRRVEGYSLAECAEATGASLATVKRRIARAQGVVEPAEVSR